MRGSYAERDIGEGVSERSNENARKVSGAADAHGLPCGERASVFCFPGYGQPERKPGSGEAIQACATPPERPVWCLVEGEGVVLITYKGKGAVFTTPPPRRAPHLRHRPHPGKLHVHEKRSPPRGNGKLCLLLGARL